ncbi:MAG: ABC transporter permease [Elusimicrobia bacterium]|nr:ABC transporter permease [Elusimicrobiota bacterium]MBI3012627.1 ABC transporter permease [Elusimicrobiota bacterium]
MNRKIVVQILFYSALIALWQTVISLEIWPEYLFPSPRTVLHSLLNGFGDSTFLIGIRYSMQRILIGYGLSILGGLALGFLLARSLVLQQSLGSLVLGLHTLPSICWLPLGILWFGLSDAAIVLVIVLGSLFSLTIATNDAIKNINPIYVRAAKTMGSKGWRLYLEVVLPAALPGIVSGLKQGWSFAWRSLMAGELIFVSLGLGHLLQMGRELNDTAQVFAVMIVIVMIGLVVDFWIFGQAEKKIRSRWGLLGSRG